MIRVVSLMIMLDGLVPRPAAAWGAAPASVPVPAAMAVAARLAPSNSQSRDVCGESLPTSDRQAFEKALATAIDGARSLDQIKAWLEAQPCVKSVQLADYLLKSNPPQRDFIVEFRMDDGSAVVRIVNIFVLSNQQFKFHKLRDK